MDNDIAVPEVLHGDAGLGQHVVEMPLGQVRQERGQLLLRNEENKIKKKEKEEKKEERSIE